MKNLNVKFCGAAQVVTGSCHLVELPSGKKLLLDCGLYQGKDDDMEDFNRNFLFDPEEIDAVILSHAHIDHTGRLPRLVRQGYQGKVITTHATRDLCSIMLMDSAYIQEKDAEYENRWRAKKNKPLIEPLYNEEDVMQAMTQFMSIGYNTYYPIPGLVDEVYVQFRDAGHILGSASVTLRIIHEGEEVVLGFTGDIGRPDRPILKDPEPMPQCDYLICESTYGDRLHKNNKEEENQLLEIIQKTCVEQRGKVIIPAFSVGRTQEIVYKLDQLANENKLPRVPIFVDSPMAIDATDVFRMHPECFDRNLTNYMLTDPNPFGFHDLHYVKRVADSKKLNTMKEPCVIISASGMITGGRIMHHVYNNIQDENNTLLIVGYAAPYTIGGQIRSGADTIKLFDQQLQVNANVVQMESFSAHGDYKEMKDFIDNQDRAKLKKIFLVHGEIEPQQIFANYLKENGFESIEIPNLGEMHELS